MVSLGSMVVLATLAIWIGAVEAEPDFCKRPKPWSLSDIRPDIFIYTQNKSDQVVIRNDTDMANLVDKLVREDFLRSTRPVTFLVHGYFGYTPWATWMGEVKDALMKVEDATVLLVDWSRGADVFYNYGESASNTQTVATLLAKLAAAILNTEVFKGDADLMYMQCIGHSLGAHVCGQAGRQSKLFDRATGLDPAGPGFENCTDHLNIDVDSATCVDNIHTDGTKEGHWNPIVPHFGTLQAWGHVDFYPNGGKNQPGCWTNDVPPCSHSRAPELFAYTIENDPGLCTATIDPTTCNNSRICSYMKQPMGYYSSCHKRGKIIMPGSYFLTTGKDKPFC